jgi:ribosomal-protein-alanine N-acetyltransferase
MSEVFCRGNEVYLRAVEPGDARLMAKWKRDPLVRRMALGPDVEISVEGENEDIKRARESGDQLYLVLVVEKTNQPVGYVRINWMDASHRFAWLRFALGERRGKGYAKDGLKALLEHLFTVDVHRVEAEAYEFNQTSLHLLEGLGFKKEGVKRQAHFGGDRYHDIVVLGLLAEEFVPTAASNHGMSPDQRLQPPNDR